MAKNPEILGQAMAPILKVAVPLVGKVGLFGAAADWTYKVAAPAIDVWNHPENLGQAKKDLAHNIGGGLLDYAVLGAGGIAGGAAGFKFMYEPKFWQPPANLKLNSFGAGMFAGNYPRGFGLESPERR